MAFGSIAAGLFEIDPVTGLPRLKNPNPPPVPLTPGTSAGPRVTEIPDEEIPVGPDLAGSTVYHPVYNPGPPGSPGSGSWRDTAAPPHVIGPGSGSWRGEEGTPQHQGDGITDIVTKGAGPAVNAIPDAAKQAANVLGDPSGLLSALTGAIGKDSGIGNDKLVTFENERAQAAEAYRRGLGISDQAAAFEGASIRDVDPIRAQQIAAERISAQQIQAQQIAAERISAQQIAAPTMGPAATANASTVGQTTIDVAQANEARARQMGALSTIEQEAAGNGVGGQLAQARVASALERIKQQGQGAANTATGAERAGARRDVMMQSGQLGLQAALAAEEQALQARLGSQQAALTGASQVRAGDVDVATRQASIDADRKNLDAQLATAVSQGNAQEINRLTLAKSDLELRASQSNQGASLTASQANQSSALQASQANQGASLQASQSNQAADLQAGAANQSATLRAAEANQGADLTAQTKTQELGVARDVQNAASKRGDQDTRIGGQVAGVNAATGATGASTQAGAAENQAITAREQAKALEKAGMLAAGAAVGSSLIKSLETAAPVAAAAASDKRVKKNIQTESPEDISDFLEALKAVSYNYKANPPGQGLRHGLLAQDLEKSKIGKSTVFTAANGTKMVDPTALTLALAAAVADQLPRKERR